MVEIGNKIAVHSPPRSMKLETPTGKRPNEHVHRAPHARLNSCSAHQIISGRCCTRAYHPRWVASVVFCKRRLPVNFSCAPLTIELVLRCNMSRRAEGTNPLTRERAARGAEFVATTEDAVEIG